MLSRAFKIFLHPFKPVILLPGIYPKEIQRHKNKHTRMIIAALFLTQNFNVQQGNW